MKPAIYSNIRSKCKGTFQLLIFLTCHSDQLLGEVINNAKRYFLLVT